MVVAVHQMKSTEALVREGKSIRYNDLYNVSHTFDLVQVIQVMYESHHYDLLI